MLPLPLCVFTAVQKFGRSFDFKIESPIRLFTDLHHFGTFRCALAQKGLDFSRAFTAIAPLLLGERLWVMPLILEQDPFQQKGDKMNIKSFTSLEIVETMKGNVNSVNPKGFGEIFR